MSGVEAGRIPLRPVKDVPGFTQQEHWDFNAARQLELAVRRAKMQHRQDTKQNMTFIEERELRESLLWRARRGVSPLDLVKGEMSNGDKITGYSIELCDPKSFGGNTLNMELQLQRAAERKDGGPLELASGITTKMGATAGDKAIVRSFWDNGAYGNTAGVIDPVMLAEQLITFSRGLGVMTPWFKPLFAPDLNFKGLIKKTNTVIELFQGADYGTLKTAVVPRTEGQTSAVFIRPKYDEHNWSVRCYMIMTMDSLEALTSRAGQITGAWEDALMMLAEGAGYIDEYDGVMALVTGIDTGYTRRWSTSGPAWDSSTNEVPRTKAYFIGVNAYKHQCYYDFVGEQIYTPKQHATDYLKYLQADAFVDNGIFPNTGHKVLELISYIAWRLSQKFRKCEAVCLPNDILVKLGFDQRMSNLDFKYAVPPNPQFAGAPGYRGRVWIPMRGEIDIWGYENGAVPPFVTTDSPTKTIDYVGWGGEYGKAVLNASYWPFQTMLTPGMTTQTLDAATIITPTLQTVAAGFWMSGIEPWDLDSIFLVKFMKGSPATDA